MKNNDSNDWLTDDLQSDINNLSDEEIALYDLLKSTLNESQHNSPLQYEFQ